MRLLKINTIKHYIKSRPKELVLAVIVGGTASLMIYTLVLQNIVDGSSRRQLRISDKLDETTTSSPLTGLEVPKELAARRVTALVIENSPDARPQSSLSQAGVVFEAVAEGGITRFVAFYQETRPQVIGPVRSLRPYYLDWAMGYDAAVAHVGGSHQALMLAAQRGARDLDQMTYSASFWRAGDRSAPHNVYTSFDKLDELQTRIGYGASNFAPYKRKKDSPAAAPTNTVITVDYSGPVFAAQFRYDQANNRYLRFIAGIPDVDRESNEQINVKNVVVLNMPTSYNGQYAVMPSVGNGTAIIFRDGIAVAANWNKADPKAAVRLTDPSNADIPLNAGATWFAVAPVGRPVTY